MLSESQAVQVVPTLIEHFGVRDAQLLAPPDRDRGMTIVLVCRKYTFTVLHYVLVTASIEACLVSPLNYGIYSFHSN